MGLQEALPESVFRPVDRSGSLEVKVILSAAVALALLRVLLALRLPISFDEAYFWLWSKHLAVSYYDHPPLIALAIKFGTMLFGDTEFGVRFVSVVASFGASWAVWSSARILLADERAAAIACLFFNLTIMIAAESLSATPDALVVAASAFMLWGVAKLEAEDDGRWWLAVGLAAGVALLSKYTSFFLCAGVGLWVVTTPTGRIWLRSGWLYVGGFLALLFLVPNLVWNSQHNWISFGFQFGRVVEGDGPSVRYALEFVAAQLALASPFILALALMGLVREVRFAKFANPLAYAAIGVLPAIVYFSFHCLHARVQGNWPSFIYPALCVLAASATQGNWRGTWSGSIAELSRKLAVPVAALMLFGACTQAFFEVLPIGRKDPIARMMGVGFEPVARQISTLVAARHATALVTTNYLMTSWLLFYLHRGIPVIQIGQDYRWLSSPPASARDLNGSLLYVTEGPQEFPILDGHFAQIAPVAAFDRMEGRAPIDPVHVYALSGYRGAATGRMP